MSVLAKCCGKRCLSVLLACVVGSLLSCAASAQVQWRTGADSAIPALSPEQIRTTLTDLNIRAAESGLRRVVVQFKAPVDNAQRARLANAGLVLLSPLGDNAFFASLSPVAGALDSNAIAADPTLYSVREIRDQWKLDAFLQADMVPEWAVVKMQESKSGGFEPVFGAYVTFHKDVDLNTEAAALTARYGAFVRSLLAPINAMVIEIPRSQVKPLASEDAVAWIEPAIWQLGTMNSSNRERTGVNIVQAAPYGLTGSGVSVMVYDAGASRTTHVDFQGRAANRDTVALSDHATHVSGTIGGAGVANPLHKGIAPGVTIHNYGFELTISGSDFLYTNPGDLLHDYTDAITNHGVSIANNSIGNNTAPNGHPCEWQGNYGTTDALIDSIARGAIAQEEIIIVWATGNERQTVRCWGDGPAPGTGYATIAPPAAAKNHITVGALYSDDDNVTSFSSWGPTDDGRMKPDVSAPGSQHGPHAGTNDGGVTSTSALGGDSGYSTKSGTSMAAPTTAGVTALLLEEYRRRFPGEPDLNGAAAKAILAHSAEDVGAPGPDYRTGYGSIRVAPAVELLSNGQIIEGAVEQGAVFVTTVFIQEWEDFKATLAWSDPPAALNVVPSLVNDLDLRVIDPNGVRHYPWTLDPLIPQALAVANQPNSLDNIEQVVVGADGEPVPRGVWRIEVVGTNVPPMLPDDPTPPQRFSLVLSKGILDAIVNPLCPTDIDRDRLIGFGDLNYILSAFNTRMGDAGWIPAADVNENGMIGFDDLNEVLSRFNTLLPAPPTDLRTVSVYSNRATLAWTDNAADEIQYRIERREAGSWVLQENVPANGNMATVTGLELGETYRFRVVADGPVCDTAGVDPASVLVTTNCDTQAPTGASVLRLSPTSARVTWIDNSTNEVQFRIERWTGSGWALQENVPANASQAIVTGLQANANYLFRVVADGPECDSPSNEFALDGDDSCPGAPTGLRVVAEFSNRAILAWEDNSSNEVQFRIERWTGSSWSLQENVPANGTQATVTGLTLGQMYTFRVVADGELCDSPCVNPDSVTVTAMCDTAAPSSVGGFATGPTSVQVTWVDNSNNEVQFQIQRWNGSAWVLQENVPANATQASVTGLSPSTTYRFRVVADGPECDGVGGEFEATTTSGCPGAPSNLRALAVFPTRVTLAWNDNSTNEQQFRIERWNGSAWVLQENVPANGVQATVTGLALGQTYMFRVVADGEFCDTPGVSPATVTVTTVCDTAAPTDFRATESLPTRIRVAWNDNSNNEVQFRIERFSGGNWILQENAPANATTALLTGLQVDTTYRFRIIADGPECDAIGNEIQVATTCDTAAPTGCQVIGVGSTFVRIRWNDNSDNELQFRIERRQGSNWVFQENVPANGEQAQIDGLNPDTQYTFRVVADGPECDAVGCQVTATTN